MSAKRLLTSIGSIALLLSFGLITTGCALIWTPLGFIVGGLFVGLMAIAAHKAAKEEKS